MVCTYIHTYITYIPHCTCTWLWRRRLYARRVHVLRRSASRVRRRTRQTDAVHGSKHATTFVKHLICVYVVYNMPNFIMTREFLGVNYNLNRLLCLSASVNTSAKDCSSLVTISFSTHLLNSVCSLCLNVCEYIKVNHSNSSWWFHTNNPIRFILLRNFLFDKINFQIYPP